MALVLLAVYRSARRALVPLIPIVLRDRLVVARSSGSPGVPLNPMSATLGALVIAIATEFSVLLAARYYEERAAGGSLGEALRRAYARTGAAVLASGVTAIAGFAVLVVTDIRMLRDFGLVTVLDLGVALSGVLLVLPAALVWAEGGFRPLSALAAAAATPRPPGAGSTPAERHRPGHRRSLEQAAGGRYSTFVGLAFLVLIVVATLNTHSHRRAAASSASAAPIAGHPAAGVRGARTVRGPLDADANIFQDNCSTSENPCPADAKRTPACEINCPPSRRSGSATLQSAAGDLVLVHPRARTACRPRTR